MLQICLNMSERCLSMPKYTLKYQTKKCSKYARVLNMLDALAYCMYLIYSKP